MESALQLYDWRTTCFSSCMPRECETVIRIPDRWMLEKCSDPARELDRIAGLLVVGIGALGGLYLRMCDLVRNGILTESQSREILSRHFPPPRVSEILRVAGAPDEVYNRYRAGFFGFKAALRECRGYRVTPSRELRRRKLQRAAERLLELLGGEGEINIRDRSIVVF